MTKVMRFFTTCLLVVSMAAVALADGGETHGPGLAPPQPPITECTANCNGNEGSLPLPEPSIDASDLAKLLVTWFVQSTF